MHLQVVPGNYWCKCIDFGCISGNIVGNCVLPEGKTPILYLLPMEGSLKNKFKKCTKMAEKTVRRIYFKGTM